MRKGLSPVNSDVSANVEIISHMVLMPHEYVKTSLVGLLQPETVAAYLVPRVRTVVARKSLSTYIKYLTIPRALGKFLTAPTKANKYFDKQGVKTLLFTPDFALAHTAQPLLQCAYLWQYPFISVHVQSHRGRHLPKFIVPQYCSCFGPCEL